jgi:hypothetical protein
VDVHVICPFDLEFFRLKYCDSVFCVIMCMVIMAVSGSAYKTCHFCFFVGSV